MIFDKHAHLKYKFGNRHFWCRGYYVDTVGRYEGAIKEYIRNQLQEDIEQDTLNFKEISIYTITQLIGNMYIYCCQPSLVDLNPSTY